jgi:hypothetical protein
MQRSAMHWFSPSWSHHMADDSDMPAACDHSLDESADLSSDSTVAGSCDMAKLVAVSSRSHPPYLTVLCKPSCPAAGAVCWFAVTKSCRLRHAGSLMSSPEVPTRANTVVSNRWPTVHFMYDEMHRSDSVDGLSPATTSVRRRTLVSTSGMTSSHTSTPTTSTDGAQLPLALATVNSTNHGWVGTTCP